MRTLNKFFDKHDPNLDATVLRHHMVPLMTTGDATLDLTRNFNEAQRRAHASLANTPELTLIHGPFGTGKTTLLVNHGLETVSNPNCDQNILYVVESNAAVDDVTLRFQRAADEHNLSDLQILRAHTLKDEKTEVYVTAKNHAITVGADDAWSTMIPRAHAAILQQAAPITNA
jgi:hypothetical protein